MTALPIGCFQPPQCPLVNVFTLLFFVRIGDAAQHPLFTTSTAGPFLAQLSRNVASDFDIPTGWRVFPFLPSLLERPSGRIYLTKNRSGAKKGERVSLPNRDP